MNNSKSKIVLKPILLGVLVGLICALVFLIIFSFVILKSGQTSNEILDIISLVILSLSTFSSGYISGKISKSKGILYGLFCSLILFMFIVIGAIIVGNYDLSLTVVLKFIISVLFGCAGGVLGVNKS